MHRQMSAGSEAATPTAGTQLRDVGTDELLRHRQQRGNLPNGQQRIGRGGCDLPRSATFGGSFQPTRSSLLDFEPPR